MIVGDLPPILYRLDSSGFAFDVDVYRLVPPNLLEQNKMIPMNIRDGVLTLACTDTSNLAGIDEIRRVIRGVEINPVGITDGDYRQFLEKNVRTRVGEIDLVAKEGKTLVFVEVKTRREIENAPPPQVGVHTRKQNKLGKLAQSYLRSKRLREQPCRFDVVAVVVNDEGGVKAIRHIPNAFSVAAW